MRSWSQKPRDDINTSELGRVSCDGGRWREERTRRDGGKRNVTGQSSTRRTVASGINITARCSAKDLTFLLFLPVCLSRPNLKTSLQSHFSLLFLSSLHLCTTPSRQHDDVSLPTEQKQRWKKDNTYQISIPPLTQHPPANIVFKLILLWLSAHYTSDPPLTCFLFFFSLLSLFSRSLCVSPVYLKNELGLIIISTWIDIQPGDQAKQTSGDKWTHTHTHTLTCDPLRPAHMAVACSTSHDSDLAARQTRW